MTLSTSCVTTDKHVATPENRNGTTMIKLRRSTTQHSNSLAPSQLPITVNLKKKAYHITSGKALHDSCNQNFEMATNPCV